MAGKGKTLCRADIDPRASYWSPSEVLNYFQHWQLDGAPLSVAGGFRGGAFGPSSEPDQGVVPLLREAVRACCGREAFRRSAAEMSATRNAAADDDLLQEFLLQIFSIPGVPPAMVRDILLRFERERDRCRTVRPDCGEVA
jgi:hypothetical protein